jgi:hypothetical protein
MHGAGRRAQAQCRLKTIINSAPIVVGSGVPRLIIEKTNPVYAIGMKNHLSEIETCLSSDPWTVPEASRVFINAGVELKKNRPYKIVFSLSMLGRFFTSFICAAFLDPKDQIIVFPASFPNGTQ